MKKSAKKLILWGAAAAAGALGFTACRNRPETVYGPPTYFNPDPSENVPQDVYGPPPLEETEPDDVTASETDTAGDVAESAESAETAEETAAGNAARPSEAAETDASGNAAESSEAAETDPEFDPSENIPEDVYGPPSWFGMPDEEPEDDDPSGNEFNPEEEIPEAVYGPPEWWQDNESLGPEITYDPSLDIQPLVYGPPEYFEQNRDQKYKDMMERDTEVITTEENILYPVYGPPDAMK